MLRLCVLIAVLRIALAEEEIGSPLRIAQCRANCILKFSADKDSQKICFHDPDCFMCWENCQLLQANFPIWGSVCSEPGICFPGCQEACRFHREMSPVQTVPVIQTRGEEVIFVKNDTAYWPAPTRTDSEPLVYVVMRRSPGKVWRQITQTLQPYSRIPDEQSMGSLLRVLVVNRDGLMTIYSPVASDSLRNAGDIARGAGQTSLNTLISTTVTGNASSHGRRINTEIGSPSNSSGMDQVEYTSWNLREISLIHQKVLVIAEIAWDAVPTHVIQHPVYFVTWEVDGGGLKGNLFTDSTCVTLSLWPDTVYHIQVELIGHNVATGRPQQSEDFVLDTHRAIAVELETASMQDHQIRVELMTPNKIHMLSEKEQLEVFFAVGTAFALFLLVLVVVVYATCRHGDITYPRRNDIFALKPNKEFTDIERFPKEFVPILTLVTENMKKSSNSPVNTGHQDSTKPTADRFARINATDSHV